MQPIITKIISVGMLPSDGGCDDGEDDGEDVGGSDSSTFRNKWSL